jgi:CheY-like chemotaxis protein
MSFWEEAPRLDGVRVLVVEDIPHIREVVVEALRQRGARVTARGGSTPAAAFTGCTTREDRLNALRAGFQYHVAKPAELSRLAQVVALLSLRGTLAASRLQQQRH